MVADSLIPMHSGLQPVAAPPVEPRALWARVVFDNDADLATALDHLEPIVAAPGLERVLLQLRYAPKTLTRTAGALHRDFMARHEARLTGWQPFCLPGSANYAELGALATPADCRGCLFYQGRACQGLGDELEPFSGLSGGLALQRLGPTRSLDTLRDADFIAQVPAAYWMPERVQIATIGAIARANSSRRRPVVWDIGAGNGLFGALLARDEGLDVTLIDQIEAYPTPAGVRRIIQDARAPVPGPPPDMLFISWPPTGDGFRELIEKLDPKVVVYARDLDGFCGRNLDHCGVIARATGLEWHAFAVDDFAPLTGKVIQAQWHVRCHHDLLKGAPTRSGSLEVRAALPGSPPAQLTPYPWEPRSTEHAGE